MWSFKNFILFVFNFKENGKDNVVLLISNIVKGKGVLLYWCIGITKLWRNDIGFMYIFLNKYWEKNNINLI